MGTSCDRAWDAGGRRSPESRGTWAGNPVPSQPAGPCSFISPGNQVAKGEGL